MSKCEKFMKRISGITAILLIIAAVCTLGYFAFNTGRGEDPTVGGNTGAVPTVDTTTDDGFRSFGLADTGINETPNGNVLYPSKYLQLKQMGKYNLTDAFSADLSETTGGKLSGSALGGATALNRGAGNLAVATGTNGGEQYYRNQNPTYVFPYQSPDDHNWGIFYTAMELPDGAYGQDLSLNLDVDWWMWQKGGASSGWNYYCKGFTLHYAVIASPKPYIEYTGSKATGFTTNTDWPYADNINGGSIGDAQLGGVSLGHGLIIDETEESEEKTAQGHHTVTVDLSSQYVNTANKYIIVLLSAKSVTGGTYTLSTNPRKEGKVTFGNIVADIKPKNSITASGYAQEWNSSDTVDIDISDVIQGMAVDPSKVGIYDNNNVSLAETYKTTSGMGLAAAGDLLMSASSSVSTHFTPWGGSKGWNDGAGSTTTVNSRNINPILSSQGARYTYDTTAKKWKLTIKALKNAFKVQIFDVNGMAYWVYVRNGTVTTDSGIIKIDKSETADGNTSLATAMGDVSLKSGNVYAKETQYIKLDKTAAGVDLKLSRPLEAESIDYAVDKMTAKETLYVLYAAENSVQTYTYEQAVAAALKFKNGDAGVTTAADGCTVNISIANVAATRGYKLIIWIGNDAYTYRFLTEANMISAQKGYGIVDKWSDAFAPSNAPSIIADKAEYDSAAVTTAIKGYRGNANAESDITAADEANADKYYNAIKYTLEISLASGEMTNGGFSLRLNDKASGAYSTLSYDVNGAVITPIAESTVMEIPVSSSMVTVTADVTNKKITVVIDMSGVKSAPVTVEASIDSLTGEKLGSASAAGTWKEEHTLRVDNTAASEYGIAVTDGEGMPYRSDRWGHGTFTVSNANQLNTSMATAATVKVWYAKGATDPYAAVPKNGSAEDYAFTVNNAFNISLGGTPAANAAYIPAETGLADSFNNNIRIKVELPNGNTHEYDTGKIKIDNIIPAYDGDVTIEAFSNTLADGTVWYRAYNSLSDKSVNKIVVKFRLTADTMTKYAQLYGSSGLNGAGGSDTYADNLNMVFTTSDGYTAVFSRVLNQTACDLMQFGTGGDENLIIFTINYNEKDAIVRSDGRYEGVFIDEMKDGTFTLQAVTNGRCSNVSVNGIDTIDGNNSIQKTGINIDNKRPETGMQVSYTAGGKSASLGIRAIGAETAQSGLWAQSINSIVAGSQYSNVSGCTYTVAADGLGEINVGNINPDELGAVKVLKNEIYSNYRNKPVVLTTATGAGVTEKITFIVNTDTGAPTDAFTVKSGLGEDVTYVTSGAKLDLTATQTAPISKDAAPNSYYYVLKDGSGAVVKQDEALAYSGKADIDFADAAYTAGGNDFALSFDFAWLMAKTGNKGFSGSISLYVTDAAGNTYADSPVKEYGLVYDTSDYTFTLAYNHANNKTKGKVTVNNGRTSAELTGDSLTAAYKAGDTLTLTAAAASEAYTFINYVYGLNTVTAAEYSINTSYSADVKSTEVTVTFKTNITIDSVINAANIVPDPNDIVSKPIQVKYRSGSTIAEADISSLTHLQYAIAVVGEGTVVDNKPTAYGDYSISVTVADASAEEYVLLNANNIFVASITFSDLPKMTVSLTMSSIQYLHTVLAAVENGRITGGLFFMPSIAGTSLVPVNDFIAVNMPEVSYAANPADGNNYTMTGNFITDAAAFARLLADPAYAYTATLTKDGSPVTAIGSVGEYTLTLTKDFDPQSLTDGILPMSKYAISATLNFNVTAREIVVKHTPGNGSAITKQYDGTTTVNTVGSAAAILENGTVNDSYFDLSVGGDEFYAKYNSAETAIINHVYFAYDSFDYGTQNANVKGALMKGLAITGVSNDIKGSDAANFYLGNYKLISDTTDNTTVPVSGRDGAFDVTFLNAVIAPRELYLAANANKVSKSYDATTNVPSDITPADYFDVMYAAEGVLTAWTTETGLTVQLVNPLYDDWSVSGAAKVLFGSAKIMGANGENTNYTILVKFGETDYNYANAEITKKEIALGGFTNMRKVFDGKGISLFGFANFAGGADTLGQLYANANTDDKQVSSTFTNLPAIFDGALTVSAGTFADNVHKGSYSITIDSSLIANYAITDGVGGVLTDTYVIDAKTLIITTVDDKATNRKYYDGAIPKAYYVISNAGVVKNAALADRDTGDDFAFVLMDGNDIFDNAGLVDGYSILAGFASNAITANVGSTSYAIVDENGAKVYDNTNPIRAYLNGSVTEDYDIQAVYLNNNTQYRIEKRPIYISPTDSQFTYTGDHITTRIEPSATSGYSNIVIYDHDLTKVLENGQITVPAVNGAPYGISAANAAGIFRQFETYAWATSFALSSADGADAVNVGNGIYYWDFSGGALNDSEEDFNITSNFDIKMFFGYTEVSGVKTPIGSMAEITDAAQGVVRVTITPAEYVMRINVQEKRTAVYNGANSLPDVNSEKRQFLQVSRTGSGATIVEGTSISIKDYTAGNIVLEYVYTPAANVPSGIAAGDCFVGEYKVRVKVNKYATNPNISIVNMDADGYLYSTLDLNTDDASARFDAAKLYSITVTPATVKVSYNSYAYGYGERQNSSMTLLGFTRGDVTLPAQSRGNDSVGHYYQYGGFSGDTVKIYYTVNMSNDVTAAAVTDGYLPAGTYDVKVDEILSSFGRTGGKDAKCNYNLEFSNNDSSEDIKISTIQLFIRPNKSSKVYDGTTYEGYTVGSDYVIYRNSDATIVFDSWNTVLSQYATADNYIFKASIDGQVNVNKNYNVNIVIDENKLANAIGSDIVKNFTLTAVAGTFTISAAQMNVEIKSQVPNALAVPPKYGQVYNRVTDGGEATFDNTAKDYYIHITIDGKEYATFEANAVYKTAYDSMLAKALEQLTVEAQFGDNLWNANNINTIFKVYFATQPSLSDINFNVVIKSTAENSNFSIGRIEYNVGISDNNTLDEYGVFTWDNVVPEVTAADGTVVTDAFGALLKTPITLSHSVKNTAADGKVTYTVTADKVAYTDFVNTAEKYWWYVRIAYTDTEITVSPKAVTVTLALNADYMNGTNYVFLKNGFDPRKAAAADNPYSIATFTADAGAWVTGDGLKASPSAFFAYDAAAAAYTLYVAGPSDSTITNYSNYTVTVAGTEGFNYDPTNNIYSKQIVLEKAALDIVIDGDGAAAALADIDTYNYSANYKNGFKLSYDATAIAAEDKAKFDEILFARKLYAIDTVYSTVEGATKFKQTIVKNGAQGDVYFDSANWELAAYYDVDTTYAYSGTLNKYVLKYAFDTATRVYSIGSYNADTTATDGIKWTAPALVAGDVIGKELNLFGSVANADGTVTYNTAASFRWSNETALNALTAGTHTDLKSYIAIAEFDTANFFYTYEICDAALGDGANASFVIEPLKISVEVDNTIPFETTYALDDLSGINFTALAAKTAFYYTYTVTENGAAVTKKSYVTAPADAASVSVNSPKAMSVGNNKTYKLQYAVADANYALGNPAADLKVNVLPKTVRFIVDTSDGWNTSENYGDIGTYRTIVEYISLAAGESLCGTDKLSDFNVNFTREGYSVGKINHAGDYPMTISIAAENYNFVLDNGQGGNTMAYTVNPLEISVKATWSYAESGFVYGVSVEEIAAYMKLKVENATGYDITITEQFEKYLGTAVIDAGDLPVSGIPSAGSYTVKALNTNADVKNFRVTSVVYTDANGNAIANSENGISVAIAAAPFDSAIKIPAADANRTIKTVYDGMKVMVFDSGCIAPEYAALLNINDISITYHTMVYDPSTGSPTVGGELMTTPKDAGIYRVTIKINDTDFDSAEYKYVLVIEKKAIETGAYFAGRDRVYSYGDAVAYALSGLTAEESASYEISYSADGVAYGEWTTLDDISAAGLIGALGYYKVRASVSAADDLDNANHIGVEIECSFTIVRKNVNFVLSNLEQTYGSAGDVIIGGAEGLIRGTDYTVTYANENNETVELPTTVGRYRVTVEAVGNYAGSVSRDVTVKKYSMDLSGVTLTAAPEGGLIFGDENCVNGFEVTLNGLDPAFANDVTVTGHVNGVPTERILLTNAGTYEITFLFESDNISFVNAGAVKGSYTVAKKALTADDVTVVPPNDSAYDGVEKVFGIKYNDEDLNCTITESKVVTGTAEDGSEITADALPVNAGKYRIKFAIDDVNYSGEAYIEYEITKRVLEYTIALPVQGESDKIVYDGALYEATFTGDPDYVDAVHLLNGKEAEPINAGKYVFKLTLKDAANCKIRVTSQDADGNIVEEFVTELSVEFTIDKASADILKEGITGADAIGKVNETATYDGKQHRLTPDTSSLVLPEGASVAIKYRKGSSKSFTSSVVNAGTYKVFVIVSHTNYGDVEIAAGTITIEPSKAEGSVTARKDDSLTVESVDGAMYQLCDKDGNVISKWQSSNKFTGLDKGTEYIVQIKVEDDNNYTADIIEIKAETTHTETYIDTLPLIAACAGGGLMLIGLITIVIVGVKRKRRMM